MSDLEYMKRETRGPCALCGLQVFTDEPRERHAAADGVQYRHQRCPPAATSVQQAAAAAALAEAVAERERERERASERTCEGGRRQERYSVYLLC